GTGMDERLVRRSAPFPLYDVVLGDASATQLAQLSERMGLALSVDEMRRIQEHFRRIGREPTDIELQSLGQAWSEHCCYKSSKVFLKEFIFPVQTAYVIDRGDAGVVVFDEGYLGNVVVNVACVGFAKKSQLVRNRATSVRDVFILCGGKTGRDGIHGVTYASGDLTDRAVREWETGAVQLGDPILKEPLIHACIESAQARLLAGMKDLGGGGLSCVVGEMALAGGFGAEVDLEKVPLKEEGLAPWEIWGAESQERMMLAVLPEHVE